MKLTTKGLLLLISVWLFSCSEDELKYSCDREVDNYVNENLAALKSVNTEELSTYSDELQKAAYRSFSPQKKYEVWVEKLKILSEDNNFTAEEQEHILNLQIQLTPELFNPQNTSTFADFISFYNKWETEAFNKLSWDKTILVFITYSLNIYYDDFLATSPLVAPTGLNSADCYCSQSSDGCPNGSYCGGAVCTGDTPVGCGVLWLEDCDGVCVEG